MGAALLLPLLLLENPASHATRNFVHVKADAIAAARYLTEEALAKCAGAGLM